MHKVKQAVMGCVVVFGVSLGLLATGVQAQSGSLEPPGSAVNPSGDPVATTQTQPSWDQTLPANDGRLLGCDSTRFKCVMGGAAVLDKNTGLVWEQSPWTTHFEWPEARFHCISQKGVGAQMGWRLPSIHELTSLLVPGDPAGGPDLPPGHPFSNVQGNFPSFGYWSATTSVHDPLKAWMVDFFDGDVFTIDKDGPPPGHIWCVRGGGPLSEY